MLKTANGAHLDDLLPKSLSLLSGITIRFIKKSDICISGVYFPRMQSVFRNEIPITFSKCFCFSANCQIDSALQHDTDLCGMGMFGQIYVFFKFHEYDLMGVGLGKIGFYALKRDVGFRKISNRFGKCL
jgi:hypothetical protein